MLRGKTRLISNYAKDRGLQSRTMLRIGVVFIILAGLMTFYYCSMILGDVSIPPLLLLLLLALAVGTIVTPFFIESHIDIFAPTVFYMLLRSQYVGKPILQLWRGEYYNSQLPFLSQRESYGLLTGALSILVLGQTCYLLGYYTRAYRLIPSFNLPFSKQLSERRRNIAALFLFALCAISYILILHHVGSWKGMWDSIGLRRETYADVKYLFLPLNIFIGLIIMLIALPSFKKGRFPLWLLPAILSIIVLLAATGDRSRIIIPIIQLIIFAHYLYRRINVSKLFMIGVCLMTIAIGVQDLRDTTFSGRGMDTNVITNRSYNPVEIVQEFFSRRRTIDLMGVMLYLMPERLPYQFGMTYINIIYLPIPRSIWPDKPIIDESGIVGHALMGKNYYGLPVGTEGVLFMNFHIFGVILGTTLLGVFHRRLYDAFRRQANQPLSIIFYSIAFMSIMSFTGMGLFDALVAIIPGFIVLRFVGRKRINHYKH